MDELTKAGNEPEKRALQAILKIRDSYSQDMKQLANFLEEKELGFSPEGIKSWTAELERRLRTKEIAARSYNKMLAAVKHRMRWLFERSGMNLDPDIVKNFKLFLADMKTVKISKSEIRVNPDKVLTPEEIEELREAADPKLSLMIEFLRDTGCRITEMITAGLGQKRRDRVDIQVIGKGRKMRTVSIEKDLYRWIVKEFQGKRYLFEHSGKPYNRISVTNRLRALSGELWGRYRKIGAHVLRHSFITQALRQKVPIEQVADYVGHSSPDTTHRQYNHNIPEWDKTFKGLMKGSKP